MNKKDLQQISDLFRAGFTQIWEHNLEPAFSDLDKRLSKIEANYVTKEYLDEKLGALKAEINPKLNRVDKRTVRLTEVLHSKRMLSDSEFDEINSI